MFRLFHQPSLQIVLIACVVLLLSGCGGTQSAQYFMLDMPAVDQQEDSAPKTAYYLIIKQLDSGIMYHEDRLIFKASANEVKHWNYKKWIASPPVLLTEALKRHLTQANLFKAVLDYPASVSTRYVLDGKINAFEELDINNRWAVQVGFELRMFDLNKQHYVWQGVFGSQKSVKHKTADSVVNSINDATNECIHQAIGEIAALFSADTK